jgi:hypothetical protein
LGCIITATSTEKYSQEPTYTSTQYYQELGGGAGGEAYIEPAETQAQVQMQPQAAQSAQQYQLQQPSSQTTAPKLNELQPEKPTGIRGIFENKILLSIGSVLGIIALISPVIWDLIGPMEYQQPGVIEIHLRGWIVMAIGLSVFVLSVGLVVRAVRLARERVARRVFFQEGAVPATAPQALPYSAPTETTTPGAGAAAALYPQAPETAAVGPTSTQAVSAQAWEDMTRLYETRAEEPVPTPAPTPPAEMPEVPPAPPTPPPAPQALERELEEEEREVVEEELVVPEDVGEIEEEELLEEEDLVALEMEEAEVEAEAGEIAAEKQEKVIEPAEEPVASN